MCGLHTTILVGSVGSFYSVVVCPGEPAVNYTVSTSFIHHYLVPQTYSFVLPEFSVQSSHHHGHDRDSDAAYFLQCLLGPTVSSPVFAMSDGRDGLCLFPSLPSPSLLWYWDSYTFHIPIGKCSTIEIYPQLSFYF